MKKLKILWDMPITVEVTDPSVTGNDLDDVYRYFEYIDETFSVFKERSEISRINRHEIPAGRYSRDMAEVLSMCDQTKRDTGGYFDIRRNGMLDPSGLVKGWAVNRAAHMLREKGFVNFYIDAGGDIQASGKNSRGTAWTVGIRNPFNRHENVKVVSLENKGIATSGTYVRGQHIYDPKSGKRVTDPVSLTVIADNVYEADRFATAAFAMGRGGILFIASRENLEGYAVGSDGTAVFTPGFSAYVRV